MFEYAAKAFSAWFLGFFPLAEIYIAVPAAMATGLDDVSAILWSVTGNFTPALLIIGMGEALRKNAWINSKLDKMVSEKARSYIERWGNWFVLIGTPIIGIWAMALTAKLLNMNNRVFLITSLFSILLYAVVILVTINLGMSWTA